MWQSGLLLTAYIHTESLYRRVLHLRISTIIGISVYFLHTSFLLVIYFDVICLQSEVKVDFFFFLHKISPKALVNQTLQPVSWHLFFLDVLLTKCGFLMYTALASITIAPAAIGADANYQLLHRLCISNKQIKPITSCVPEDFAQESPSRHQVFRLANAKIHKLGISWIILFANKHLFIWNVADIASLPFIYIHVCVRSV